MERYTITCIHTVVQYRTRSTSYAKTIKFEGRGWGGKVVKNFSLKTCRQASISFSFSRHPLLVCVVDIMCVKTHYQETRSSGRSKKYCSTQVVRVVYVVFCNQSILRSWKYYLVYCFTSTYTSTSLPNYIVFLLELRVPLYSIII